MLHDRPVATPYNGTMKLGCFALVEPFTPLAHQFKRIGEMGFRYADLTDNHDGASLGVEYGFAATASLDGHPSEINRMVESAGLNLTSVCAHANLLDPTSPERYGSAQIIKAIQRAHFLGVKQVITTEGDPKTTFGHNLSREEQLFSIREKLQSPLEWAEALDIELLIENHGVLTDSIEGMADILEALNSPRVGINLDTGNCWLGGGDPLAFIKTFGDKIRHVHWKDLGAEWEPKRGTLYGCGMGLIPLGDGVIGLETIAHALVKAGFDGPTTLEVAGEASVLESARRLKDWLPGKID